MKILSTVHDLEKTGDSYVIHGNTADLMIWFLTDEIIRIRCSFERQFPEESYVLMTTAWEDRLDHLFDGERKRIKALSPRTTELDDGYVFITDSLKLLIRKDPFELELSDKYGDILYSTEGLSAFTEDPNKRRSSYARMEEDDAFFGFGEKTGPLNKNKTYIRERGTDCFGYDPNSADTLYKHIPYYIKLDRKSKKALGVFYHNFYESVFNMGCEKSNYFPRYSYFRSDGGDIDLFLIGGSGISKIVDNYTFLTGRPALLPKRALGYQGSSMYYAELQRDCDEAIIKFIDTVHR